MTKYNRNFLEEVTFKEELRQNKHNRGQCLLGLMLVANTIMLTMSFGTLVISNFNQFFLTMLIFGNGGLATYIAYEEMLKLEQRRYVAESINWLMSRA